ncbi:universal stress protein [Oceanobacillus senegalensis]|uniref:universal stress protein n=1 Tax=Oceanobacillus senegalensis TaxID=1936063 RepID=UPI000A304C41|nr:universal stress protein [Oceanobacillus senegalensis]
MGNTYSNILVAFDGSEGSVNALKEAGTIAKLSNACLTIVYVQDYKSTYEVKAPPMHGVIASAATMMNQTNVHTETFPVENNWNNYEHMAYQTVTIAKAKLIGSLIDVKTEIITGNPSKEICTFAEQNKVDLIVIGQRGESSKNNLVMGNVSNEVTNQANCPVLVVK